MDEQGTVSTRQKLLDIAQQLMMTKGYNATSIEEICKLGAVTKGAFFHYFKTKEVLGEAVLKAYWQKRYAQFTHSGWMTEPTPLQQLHGFLAVVAEVFMHDPNGFSCLAGSFTQELATVNPVFRTLVSELFADWAAQIKPILQAAKDQAAHPDSLDIDQIADHIIVVVEGALILALARQEGQVIAQHLNLLDTILQTLFA